MDINFWFQLLVIRFCVFERIFRTKKTAVHTRLQLVRLHFFEVRAQLGGGFKYFYFHPYLGKIPILTNIFRRGWNHHLDKRFCGSWFVFQEFCCCWMSETSMEKRVKLLSVKRPCVFFVKCGDVLDVCSQWKIRRGCGRISSVGNVKIW